MSRQLKEDLESIYESVAYGSKMNMKVGSGKGTTGEAGDLEGPSKETQKGTGAENTDAKKVEEAPENLQGDTVEDSKKKKGGSLSKFDELYKSVRAVVEEELEDNSIENPSLNDEIGDFPPAGSEEEAAERSGEDIGGESIKDLFNSLADIMAKIGDKLAADEGEEEILSGETEMGEGEALPEEAVESTPAPEAVGKLTAKGSMNVKGVKVVKKAVSGASSGEENGGKTKVASDTNLGPNMSQKSNGSGAAVDGRGASAFE